MYLSLICILVPERIIWLMGKGTVLCRKLVKWETYRTNAELYGMENEMTNSGQLEKLLAVSADS
jgi:hypothetical protein